MKYAEFCLEAHRNAMHDLVVVNCHGQERDLPVPFQVTDVSEAFNPLDTPLRDFAYYIRFTLPLAEDHFQRVATVAAEHGVDPDEFLEICAKAEVVSLDGSCPHCGSSLPFECEP